MLLSSPIIHTSEKKDVFEQLFQKKVHALTYDFLILLLDKNREEWLPSIIDFFMKLSDEARGIIRAQLVTAYKFAGEQLKALKKQLDVFSGKNVVLVQQVDESLLGGFVVRLDDTVIDTSLRNQLAKLRESMVSPE
jgi:F-type H+-transporting ATPase subunit delta